MSTEDGRVELIDSILNQLSTVTDILWKQQDTIMRQGEEIERLKLKADELNKLLPN